MGVPDGAHSKSDAHVSPTRGLHSSGLQAHPALHDDGREHPGPIGMHWAVAPHHPQPASGVHPPHVLWALQSTGGDWHAPAEQF